MSSDDHTHDELERMRKASEQEEAKEEVKDPLATISDADLRIRIGQIKTADNQENFASRQGDTLESAAHHYQLLIAEAERVEGDFPPSQLNRLRRSRADVPEWANRNHLAQAQELLLDHRGEQRLLAALKAGEYAPTIREHWELSKKRKQTIDVLEEELNRRQLQRQREEEEREAERVAKLREQKAS